MKAEKNQLPSESRFDQSKSLSKPVNTGPMWARIRHIEARLDANEMRVSTCRRDIDRVEKKISRDEAKIQPSEEVDPVAEIIRQMGG